MYRAFDVLKALALNNM